ncbi:MAG: alpha/beta hydrolase [Rhodocyclaceae bacterium]|nr:alpha/beta hydrolase [Rhodocyclaceae bacterium]
MSDLPSKGVLVVPGLEGSGPLHWQSRWLARHPGWQRVEQADWYKPEREAWVRAFDDAVQGSSGPPLVVAHSLGCAVVAHWVASGGHGLAAALLVAPADVDSPAHTPDSVRGFAPLPTLRMPFPSLVVASRDDPYVDLARARAVATGWGSGFVDLGSSGHINADSGLGDWLAGLALLEQLTQTSRHGDGAST